MSTDLPHSAPALPATVDDDELARAKLYGLLARLWHAPPDAALLGQLGGAAAPAAEPGAQLVDAWQALVQVLRNTTVEAAAAEYAALFVAIGKPEIFANGSYYLSGYLNEKPLARLRADLAPLGLTRAVGALETEDHVAYVFEVMRYLIAGDDPAVCSLAQQERFFRAHVQTWVHALCDAVVAHPRADIWRAVSELTRAFVQIETQAFDMLES